MVRFSWFVEVLLFCASFSCANKIVEVDTICKDAVDSQFVQTYSNQSLVLVETILALHYTHLDVAHRNTSNLG
jgi:hypothetical protein